MDILADLFWKASMEEIKNGYVYNEKQESYTCLICGQSYEEGIIYPQGEYWYEAKRAMKQHIDATHTSMFHFLLSLDKKMTGLTDVQRQLLAQFYDGQTDAQIVQNSEGRSNSTIRNHRFMLREKEKQAKIFLAIMELLGETSQSSSKTHTSSDSEQSSQTTSTKRKKREATSPFLTIPPTVRFQDERFAMTEEEYQEILRTYFPNGLDGMAKEFPLKEKRKAAILHHIIGRFERNKLYTEKEVNAILKTVYDDYAILRRYLIEYGYMDRKADGSSYWLVPFTAKPE
ncbi:DUF2087 domain-containing protein [Brevibacillus laterosporus]|uniref:DUF2087 domain-containing protein n=1 Tax=Brevibacillus laterosporus TaxID=1465 RepID=A0A502HCN6_BRELA|nr:DUF2087 domain-containing protein [Brevibacillus laterosporus]QDX92858.1 DUF2087 domain-containing protein [Brevibacillus laterosporus]TPG71213.1 DUF2087 domain-containing protein [Brevibacillus laterosporus]TPG82462.1 DUF2087 domain-containing protein [Brevibacillus laterosporus]